MTMNVPFVVVMAGTRVASRYDMDWRGKPLPIAWPTLPEAWRTLDRVLTWDTYDGAQRFAEMNGGTVKSLAEVFTSGVLSNVGKL